MAFELAGESSSEIGLGLAHHSTSSRTSYTPAKTGTVVYDTDLKSQFLWDGAAWVEHTTKTYVDNNFVDLAGATMTGDLEIDNVSPKLILDSNFDEDSTITFKETNTIRSQLYYDASQDSFVVKRTSGSTITLGASSAEFNTVVRGSTPVGDTDLTTKLYVDNNFSNVVHTHTLNDITDYDATIFATSAQGALADTALQDITAESHSDLLGLSADDHTQYHNDARGDIRYYQKSEVDSDLNLKVNKAGDTMTGDLQVDGVDPNLKINTTSLTGTAGMRLSEQGSNKGRFAYRSSPDDIVLGYVGGADIVFTSSDITLNKVVRGVTPVGTADLTTKGWVDSELSDKVDLDGDTMTGDLSVSKATPLIKIDSTSGSAFLRFTDSGSTKGQVYWNSVSDAIIVNKNGGAELKLNTSDATFNTVVRGSTPVNGGDLTTRSWVLSELTDKLNLTGGTLTGALILNANPTTNLGAATKQYADDNFVNLTTSQTIAGNKTFKNASGNTTANIAADGGSFPILDFYMDGILKARKATTGSYFVNRWYHTASGTNTEFFLRNDYLDVNKEFRGISTTAGSNNLAFTTKDWVDGELDDKVDLSGDTMTGDLEIDSATPTLTLDSNAGNDSVLNFRENGAIKSQVYFDASTDNFIVKKSGGSTLTMDAVATFNTVARASTPISNSDLTTKLYVDDGLADKFDKIGGTLSDNITIQKSTGNATLVLDSTASTGASTILFRRTGTQTGFIQSSTSRLLHRREHSSGGTDTDISMYNSRVDVNKEMRGVATTSSSNALAFTTKGYVDGDRDLKANNGDETNPSIEFTNGSGLYSSASTQIAMKINGTTAFAFGNTGADVSLTINGGTGTGGRLRMGEKSSNGTNFLEFRPADAMAASHFYIFPSSVGNVGDSLKIASKSGNEITLEWSA